LHHSGGKWNLEIKTSDLPSAGTTATVSVTVYGMSGNSLSIPLGESDGLLFSAGSTDTFKVGDHVAQWQQCLLSLWYKNVRILHAHYHIKSTTIIRKNTK